MIEFTLRKKVGAFLGKRRLQVNQEGDIKRATVTYVCGYDYCREYKSEVIKKLFNLGVTRVTENWTPSLDMCLVAAGKMEALIDDGNELYDFLPGNLIAREAGGAGYGF
ncbi:MAG: hypothetical protein M1150_03420 [Patescibacteria group bacterium]|nr:hypothetical protein [Patescibacteria group bacterium]